MEKHDMRTIISGRLEHLREFLSEKQLDAVVINKLENLHYFSGFTGDDTTLVITAQKAFLITDFRYTEQAALQAPLFEIVKQEHGLFKRTADCLIDEGVKKAGFEGNAMTYNAFKLLASYVPNIDMTNPVGLDALRRIKDSMELDYIRRAVAISDKAFDDIITFIKPGISENQVAARLEGVMRELGSERPAFTTIVASGERGSLPHGTATEKLLESGEFVTMDYGAVFNGYHSDITRTVCVGKADERHRHIYDTVLHAQLMGVELVKPGASGSAIDHAVRSYFDELGYKDNFGHGLGHSLGLEIHEEPRLSPKSDCEHLPVNTLITVEPGLYFPGWGGVRIEDTVLVTATGGEPLTQSDKRLIEIV